MLDPLLFLTGPQLQRCAVIKKTDVRIERDKFGEVQVPAAALWGAQTARTLRNLLGYWLCGRSTSNRCFSAC